MVGVRVPLTWQVRKLWDGAAERTEKEQVDLESVFWSFAWVVSRVTCYATGPPHNPQPFNKVLPHAIPQLCVYIYVFSLAGTSEKKDPSSWSIIGRLLPKIKNQKQIQEQEFVRDKASKSETAIPM